MKTLYESILDTEKDYDLPLIASNIRSRDASRVLDAVKYLHQYVLDTTERIKRKKQIENDKCYVRFGVDFEHSGCIEIWSFRGTDIFYYYTADVRRKDVKLYHWNLDKNSFLRACDIRTYEVYELTGEFSQLYDYLSKMKVS